MIPANMNKRAKKLMGLMDAVANNTSTNNNRGSSIKNQAKSPQLVQTTTTITKSANTSPAGNVNASGGTACEKCGELCYYDFTKMVQVNKKNDRRHWCPFGDPPRATKCSRCKADIIFHSLHYDDFRGVFIALDKENMNPHKCRKTKKEHLLL